MSDKPGLSLEHASSVIARDLMAKHLETFQHVIRRDHVAGKAVHVEYVNGLAGLCALLIASGQGSKDDVINGTIAKLREYVDRDLSFMGRTVQ